MVEKALMESEVNAVREAYKLLSNRLEKVIKHSPDEGIAKAYRNIKEKMDSEIPRLNKKVTDKFEFAADFSNTKLED